MLISYVLFLHLSLAGMGFCAPAWGFYGHKLINFQAIFSLPHELIGLYKPQALWLKEHAVDPDKRRYALPSEAIRHYFDLDHWAWEKEQVPDSWTDAVLLTGRYFTLENSDTIDVFHVDAWDRSIDSLTIRFPFKDESIDLSLSAFLARLRPSIEDWYAPGVHTVSDSAVLEYHLIDSIPIALDGVKIEDKFSMHGVLPYFLSAATDRLTRAFYLRDQSAIFRLSADIGHYLSDAHVPLHTTKNYNGQLTGQTGIHAFWESRVPELLAEPDFDLWVGQAEYIEDIDSFIWQIIYESYAGVSDVLSVEKSLSNSIPEHRQYEFGKRGNTVTRQISSQFTIAYHKQLNRQVEQRMRASIKAVSSIWYTAWVNAGQPDFLDTLLYERSQVMFEDSIVDTNDQVIIESVRKHE